MLSIRLQRVGRKGHPVYRVIVQEAQLQPTSGRIVAQIGTYDPHTKAVTIDKEQAETYLNNGAQPTPRVVSLLQAEKVTLPKWVEVPEKDKQKKIKNVEKLRRNQPKEEAPAEAEVAQEEKPAEEAPADEAEAVTEATPDQEQAEEVKEDASTEQSAEENSPAGEADGQETVEDAAPRSDDEASTTGETAEPAPTSDDEQPAK